jgi:OOP family OmpA-OmpF porin
MKVLKFGLFSLLLTVLCFATTAQAGIREGAFTLSPMIGFHGFEGDQKTDDGIVGGLSLGYNVSKKWAAELEFRYTDTEIEPVGVPEEDIGIWSLGMNALYHFSPDEQFVPYVSGGFGIMYFDAKNYDVDDDYMMNWGVGAKYFISEDAAVRVDLRHLVDLHSDRGFDQFSGDDVDHNYLATAGLFFQFGGVVPPVPPADSDGDGIPDLRDKCPDTPLGVMVDAVGCPPVEKPLAVYQKPVDGDDDGDGVLNSKDKCPGTERGIMVDEFGCPIKFTLQIEFDFDKDEVRPQYHEKLQKAADFINKYPGTRFLLAGHTDSRGSDEYNEGLSMRRAAAVKKYLVEKFGIAAQTLNPKGYGEAQPVDTNATDEGRQRNRRVEVILLIK